MANQEYVIRYKCQHCGNEYADVEFAVADSYDAALQAAPHSMTCSCVPDKDVPELRAVALPWVVSLL